MNNTQIESLVDYAFKIGMTQDRDEVINFTKFLGDINPHNVMEIGSKLGGNLYILSSLCTGKKISLDMQGGCHGGWILNEHPYLGDIAEHRDEFFRVSFNDMFMVSGDSHTRVALNDVKAVLGTDYLDLLYIDGDHTYAGVKQDYEMYGPLVREGGYIVFHDINESEHHTRIGCEVGKLWNEINTNGIEFNSFLHWAGIGVIKV